VLAQIGYQPRKSEHRARGLSQGMVGLAFQM